jgi:hypothetical protein
LGLPAVEHRRQHGLLGLEMVDTLRQHEMGRTGKIDTSALGHNTLLPRSPLMKESFIKRRHERKRAGRRPEL